MSDKSQRERIAKHLKAGKSLTPMEALVLYGSLRLGARIHELKREGMQIVKRMVEVGRGSSKKRVARYYALAA